MRLRQLTIHSLPGIEPGFAFEPASDCVNFVTGPNAVGKSSLARALKYLLGGVERQSDPPTLHLEAEFTSGDTRWTVQRTGRQIAWMRNGESSTPPPLPGADQFGLYRLSVESLLADDESDQTLADVLWRTLRGGFDLDSARGHVGPRFARSEERALMAKRKALGEVARKYEELQIQEAELPSLLSRIEDAEQALVRQRQIETALELHTAIGERRERRVVLDAFPAHMDRLHGDELKRLDELDRKSEELAEQYKNAQRQQAESVHDLESTGLRDSQPNPEEVSQVKALLKRVRDNAIKSENAEDAVIRALARLNDATEQFEGDGDPPKLDAHSLERARKIIEPLGDHQVRKRELQQRLLMVGAAPDDSEIEQLRDGVNALRAWLAAQAGGGQDDRHARARSLRPIIVVAAVAAVLAGITAAAAFSAGMWWALARAWATMAALFAIIYFAWHENSRMATPMDYAKRKFTETGLTSPRTWKVQAVREHLRQNVESRLDQLRLQKERAEGAEKLRAELRDISSQADGLETEKDALAKEIGIDPALSGAPFLRFIAVTEKWDEARAVHAEKEASLRALNAQLAEDAARILDFLKPWRSVDARPLNASAEQDDLKRLIIAFDAFKERLTKADKANGAVESAQSKVESLNERIQEVEADKERLFENSELEPGARKELAGRIDRIKDWRQAREDLLRAENDVNRLRGSLVGASSLIEAVECDAIEKLKHQLQTVKAKASEHTELIQTEAAIKARLQDARKSHVLEQAASDVGRAAEALKDRRDEALLHRATEVLLDNVENAFRTEREPDLLRKARERFEQVTAHAFTLELRGKDEFAARDLKQDELRSPTELSSGTRMQLLLALRLAWTEDRERGGEPLPIFLDEALTTSDESRFSVMARTLSRLAENDGRQIFYLSARRHEAALWEQATGTPPPIIDLAAVRFRSTPPASASLRVEMPPPLPPPNGQDAPTYAARIGVTPVDPRRNAGGIHLFHVFRDDLPLLHRLMDTWYIGTVGQLESLLASDAAQSAISDREVQKRLLQRCQTARTWSELWRQGRGRPVDRVALEQCPAVSDTFLDRAVGLAHELQGDGQALVQALRGGRLKGFYTSKINQLHEWLADMGYIDDAVILESKERRRLTLQRVVPDVQADAGDINMVVEWLESSIIQ